MKFSRNWLSDYVDLSGLSDEQLGERLTNIGHAIEAVEKHGDDTIFDLEVTTNRVDAMSHRGMARELAAALGRNVAPALSRREPAMRKLWLSPMGSAPSRSAESSAASTPRSPTRRATCCSNAPGSTRRPFGAPLDASASRPTRRIDSSGASIRTTQSKRFGPR